MWHFWGEVQWMLLLLRHPCSWGPQRRDLSAQSLSLAQIDLTSSLFSVMWKQWGAATPFLVSLASVNWHSNLWSCHWLGYEEETHSWDCQVASVSVSHEAEVVGSQGHCQSWPSFSQSELLLLLGSCLPDFSSYPIWESVSTNRTQKHGLMALLTFLVHYLHCVRHVTKCHIDREIDPYFIQYI